MTIAGKYDLVSSDKYDEYLKEVGIGAIKRGLVATTKPTMQWIDNGNNNWTQKTFSALKNFEISFTIGQEFDETTADDRKSKSVVTLDGNKLTHVQDLGKIKSTTTRIFNGDEMISTFTANDVTATRNYKKVA